MSEIVHICPRCRTEYREGFTMCSDCGVPLVARLNAEVENADPLVPLTLESSFDLVAELLDRLERDAIPYVIDAGTALRCLDDATAVVTQPEDWEARVHVISTRVNDAARILSDLKYQRQLERVPGALRRENEDERD